MLAGAGTRPDSGPRSACECFFFNGRRDELASPRESFSLVFEAEILPLPMAPSVPAGTLQRRSWSLSADLEL